MSEEAATAKEWEVTVVDCDRWYRGQGGGASFLLREDGHRCCLGFDLTRRGFGDHDLLNAKTPADINGDDEIQGLTTWGEDEVDFVDTAICKGLMDINDDRGINDRERMIRLNDEAANINLRFEFINVPAALAATQE